MVASQTTVAGKEAPSSRAATSAPDTAVSSDAGVPKVRQIEEVPEDQRAPRPAFLKEGFEVRSKPEILYSLL